LEVNAQPRGQLKKERRKMGGAKGPQNEDRSNKKNTRFVAQRSQWRNRRVRRGLSPEKGEERMRRGVKKNLEKKGRPVAAKNRNVDSPNAGV